MQNNKGELQLIDWGLAVPSGSMIPAGRGTPGQINHLMHAQNVA
jgi:hypothetical protein